MATTIANIYLTHAPSPRAFVLEVLENKEVSISAWAGTLWILQPRKQILPQSAIDIKQHRKSLKHALSTQSSHSHHENAQFLGKIINGDALSFIVQQNQTSHSWNGRIDPFCLGKVHFSGYKSARIQPRSKNIFQWDLMVAILMVEKRPNFALEMGLRKKRPSLMKLLEGPSTPCESIRKIFSRNLNRAE